MTFDQLFQRDGHLLLDGHRIVNVAGDVEQLCAYQQNKDSHTQPLSFALHFSHFMATKFKCKLGAVVCEPGL